MKYISDASQIHVDFSSCKSVKVSQQCSFLVHVSDPNNNSSKRDERDIKAIITSKGPNISQYQFSPSIICEYRFFF
jgi:hypothetical protein